MRVARCNRPLTISFSEEIFNRMKELTDQKNISLGEWIREAVSEKLSSLSENHHTTKQKEN